MWVFFLFCNYLTIKFLRETTNGEESRYVHVFTKYLMNCSTKGVPKIMSLAFVLLKYTYCSHFTFLCPSKYSPPAPFIVLNRHIHEELIYTADARGFLDFCIFTDTWNLTFRNK